MPGPSSPSTFYPQSQNGMAPPPPMPTHPMYYPNPYAAAYYYPQQLPPLPPPHSPSTERRGRGRGRGRGGGYNSHHHQQQPVPPQDFNPYQQPHLMYGAPYSPYSPYAASPQGQYVMPPWIPQPPPQMVPPPPAPSHAANGIPPPPSKGRGQPSPQMSQSVLNGQHHLPPPFYPGVPYVPTHSLESSPAITRAHSEQPSELDLFGSPDVVVSEPPIEAIDEPPTELELPEEPVIVPEDSPPEEPPILMLEEVEPDSEVVPIEPAAEPELDEVVVEIEEEEVEPVVEEPPPPSEPDLLLSTPSTPDSHFNALLPPSDAPPPDYAIWRRRPRVPSNAPGIIISRHARPPPDVVSGALQLTTPPESPVLQDAALPTRKPRKLGVGTGALYAFGEMDSSSSIASVSSNKNETPAMVVLVPSIPSSSSTTSSSIGTEDTATAVTSTTTATSLETSPAREFPQDDDHGEKENVKTPTGEDEPSLSPPPVTAAASSSSSGTAAPEPPTATAKAKPSSWSALFSSNSATTKNSLPTSSVTGFSIPASALSSSSSAPIPATRGLSERVHPSQRSTLLKLLQGASTPPPGGVWGSGGSAVGSAVVASSSSTSTNTNNFNKLRIVPKGLINTGNMCFANAVLQALVYCQPFRILMLEVGALLGVGSSGNGERKGRDKERSLAEKESKTPLVDATVLLLREFVDFGGNGKRRGGVQQSDAGDDDEDTAEDYFTPTYLYDALRKYKRFETIGNGQQEDAEEFFGFYLDTLEEELGLLASSLSPASSSTSSAPTTTTKQEPPSDDEEGWSQVGSSKRKPGSIITQRIVNDKSPIFRIFGGKWREATRVLGRGKDSVMISEWRSLGLDIEREDVKTIEDALMGVSQPRSIEVVNNKGQKVEGSQMTLVDGLPATLVLHLKRFAYDAKTSTVRKVAKTILFQNELVVPPAILTPALRGSSSTAPPKYTLFAVLYHHGANTASGHYTLDVFHPGEGWKNVDDEHVRNVSGGASGVFGFGEREKEERRQAYLLFYRRVR
ncbi:hypothetical protein DL96DRAFT_1565029 [Flagelloscypha sp. PMI_526]|nr:hypothetical protein DL96DRAFT_1565029 [Flagelloscypha sp. PMI_526]